MVDAARAIGDRDTSSDAWVDATRSLASPYVALDSEAGQSTFRLAHRTFVEHFQSQADFASGHRLIASTLYDGIRESANGWASANYYTVRYIAEHLVADADRTPPDVSTMRMLVGEGGWLTRSIALLGVDRTVEVIGAASKFTWEGEGGLRHGSEIRDVETVLRHSRVALSSDPAQLAAAIHVRLHEEQDPLLRSLGDRLAALSGEPWLRVSQGHLDWRHDLNSALTMSGKARAVALGWIDGRPVVAIGIDNKVVLWDPRKGSVGVEPIDVGNRPTAVALADIAGAPVIVTSAGYDGETATWDARTGRLIAKKGVPLGAAIGVGRVGDDLVIAGFDWAQHVNMVDATTLEPIEIAAGLLTHNVLGWGVDGENLVAIAVDVQPGDAESPPVRRLSIIDPSDASVLWEAPIPTTEGVERYGIAAAGRLGQSPLRKPEQDFVVAVNLGGETFWVAGKGNRDLTEGENAENDSVNALLLQLESTIERGTGSAQDFMAKLERWVPPDRSRVYVESTGIRYRSLAVGRVGEHRAVAVLLADDDDVAQVQLREVYSDASGFIEPPGPDRENSRSDRSIPKLDDPQVPAHLTMQAIATRLVGRRGSFSVNKPEDWPHFVAAKGRLNGAPILATGSIEGSVWIWRRKGSRFTPIAGPFNAPSEWILKEGWDGFKRKPSLEPTTSVALGAHPRAGLVVASVCNGALRLHAVPSGTPVPFVTDTLNQVEMVDLGSIDGRGVLVTGSKSGTLDAWDIDREKHLASVSLDSRIVALRIVVGSDRVSRIAARTSSQSEFLVELRG